MSEKLRVLIADDEPMVCVVVKKCIHWEELGLELAGVASDGQELSYISDGARDTGAGSGRDKKAS